MKKERRGLLCMILAIAVLLYGCSDKPKMATETKEEANKETKETNKTNKTYETNEETVVIPAVFLIDPATNLSENQAFIEAFNAEHEGQYYVDVKWLTESAGGYREKLKQWNVLDEMPVIITDAGFDYDFYRLLVENGRLVDLKEYMDAAPAWKSAVEPEILAECTEDSGDIYLAPLGSAVQSYAGIIYNRELLKRAGYESVPETWDEFWECLDALRANGVMPLSLHGSGSFWVSMLLATSRMYGTLTGQEFLSRDFPDSYQNASMEELLQVLGRLYGYTFADAVEVDYDEAARRFCDGEAAIFANGYWMIQAMPEEVKEQMGFAPFPGNVLMNSSRMSAWAITAGYDAAVTRGAAKLLEFRVMRDAENTRRLLEGEQQEEEQQEEEQKGELEQAYADAVRDVGIIMPNYQMKWEQEIQNDFFAEYLPMYLANELDEKEFLYKMDERLGQIRNRK